MAESKHSMILFMVYYGKLPSYFEFWLQSVADNNSVQFCIISDCINNRLLPDNVKSINMSFEDFKNTVQSKFEFKISINNFGRISQFRPALAYIFPEEVRGYDYWGYIECDLIIGNIRKFITDEILERYDKIFKLGHFQVFRNCEFMNTLFMKSTRGALDYKFAFSNNILFFEEILGMHNIANAFEIKTYDNNIFSDVKASEYLLTISSYAYKDVEPLCCVFKYMDGSLYKYYFKNGMIHEEETLYVHLQKRKMDITTENKSCYLIMPNSFSDQCDINSQLFGKIIDKGGTKADAYRKEKIQGFKRSRVKRYKEICWWKLRYIRKRIIKNGGTDLDGITRK